MRTWWGAVFRSKAKPSVRRRYYPAEDAIFRRLRLLEERLVKAERSSELARRESHAARQAVSNALRSPSGESPSSPKKRVPIQVVLGTDLDRALAEQRKDGAQ